MAILQNIQAKHSLFVGILTLLIGVWIIFYAVPELFASLFNTMIGNLILVFILILTAMKNVAVSLALAVFFLGLYNFSHYVVNAPAAPTSK
jgi:Flp pilus assembly protein TadB